MTDHVLECLEVACRGDNTTISGRFGLELIAEIRRLRAALRPFASIGVPKDWPPQCVLRFDDYPVGSQLAPRGHHAISYHKEGEALGWPTVGDYQAAARAMGEAEC